MKTINILFSFCTILLLCSCENEHIPNPQAAITINKNQFLINESMVINFTGIGEQVVIYTGDDMHDYELRNQSNTGFVVNKGLFSYSYSQPGTYKVVCVASTYYDGAVDLKRDTSSLTVTVIDDQTEIEKLSCPQIIYDEVFAERLENDEWLMILPRKVKYNNATPSISLSQRLRFYIQSDSTEVLVNNNNYSETNRYDLSNSLEIKVRSNFGTIRPYKLYTIYYPEFASFRLLGTNGAIIRNEFDYSSLLIEVTLPSGTDVSNLTPEFTTFSSYEKVFIGDTEQLTGTSAVNFTEDVTYRLVSTLAENSMIKAASTVKVKIKYQ